MENGRPPPPLVAEEPLNAVSRERCRDVRAHDGAASTLTARTRGHVSARTGTGEVHAELVLSPSGPVALSSALIPQWPRPTGRPR